MGAPAEGGCRCGQVRFRVTGAPLFTMACHCRGCQLMSGAPYSYSATYPVENFELIAGEPVIGGLHGPIRHHFCPHCMSWMFTRPEGLEHIVNLRATLLDVPPPEPPLFETWTSEALPWASTGATHSFEAFPPIESYQPMIEEFARRHAAD